MLQPPLAADRVTLPGTTLSLSRLGFGTSGLMARLDRRTSLRLLAAAHDAGVTHFDTARLYGYGEAEGVLGEFLAGRRDAVTVASKAGIFPPKRSRGLAVAKTLARQAASLWPPLRAVLRRRAEAMVHSGAFSIPDLETSLHTSLRELRTDRLDVLFLHDCTQEDLDRPELLAFLDRGQREGKFLHYGVASLPEVCATVPRTAGFEGAVVQFANSASAPNIARVVRPGEAAAVITHSALGSNFQTVHERLSGDAALAARWSDLLGIDAADRRALGGVFLAYACNANPTGAVLFSSASEANIRQNCATAELAAQATQTGHALAQCLAELPAVADQPP